MLNQKALELLDFVSDGKVRYPGYNAELFGDNVQVETKEEAEDRVYRFVTEEASSKLLLEYAKSIKGTKNLILRKGSVSARDGEKLIIPINMRDGSLICVGKGNPDWNYSAPHGAGRILSRSEAKDAVGIDEFRESMKGIYSSSVMESTIDESPMVYKPMEEIMENIKDTVDIVKVIKPVYNFKAH